MKKIIFLTSLLSVFVLAEGLSLPGLDDNDIDYGSGKKKKRLITTMEKERPINIRRVLRYGYIFHLKGEHIKKNKKSNVSIKLYSSDYKDSSMRKEVIIINKKTKEEVKEIQEIKFDENLNIVNLIEKSFRNGSLESMVSCKLESIPRKIPIKVLPGYKTSIEKLVCDDGTIIENIIKLDYARGNSHYLIEESKVIGKENNNTTIIKLLIEDDRLAGAEYTYKDNKQEIKSTGNEKDI